MKSAAETAVKAAIEPVAQKTGEVITNKIFKSTEEPDKNEEEKPIKRDKGAVIEKELKKYISIRQIIRSIIRSMIRNI